MATMIPEAVRSFQTEGEEQVYRFLANVAKPDLAHTVWYTPDVADREPDFVLCSDEVGIVVLEVKDWALQQIRKVNPLTFELQMGAKVEERTNPLRQAKQCCLELRDRIHADGRLVATDPFYHGNPKIPLSFGVVFTHINKYEYMQQGFGTVLPPDKVLFWDDLNPSSDICSDGSGRCFREAMKERFPPRYPVVLSGKDKYVLKELLFPEVRVEVPSRGGGEDEYGWREERLRVLDHNQEAIARKWDGGHRIIVGPSGSGKTLVLVHKAAFLRKYNPKIKRILFLCYNITLVNHIRRLLGAKGVPLGESGVEVLHFFELCSRVVGEAIRYEGEDGTYYDLVVQEALERVGSCGLRYDAILLDEGQDFSDEMIRVVTGLLNPETDHLTIAMDDAQNIYGPRASWKKLGVNALGRVHRLRAVYRNTREIKIFSERFSGLGGDAEATARQLELLPDLLACHGTIPEVRHYPDLSTALRTVPEIIRELQAKHGYPMSEFAVLYPMRSPSAGKGVHLPLAIQAALDAEGIVWRWASEDHRAKRSYDLTADSVTVSTAHSVKGLDFACVFLVGFDLLEPGRWTDEQIRNLTYVAMTRARYHLHVVYCRRNLVVEGLLLSRQALS
ncbi:MAG: ATP-binding domain-containing protein [Deltaproteobacteria bacterium]|nr:ATP-binding domain-containing protein [Deltaproteobacteria bacterium]